MKTQHERNAEQIHGEYRWRLFDPANPFFFDGTLQEVSAALDLDPNEVAWACEEYGRCDTDKAVAWQPGPIRTEYEEPDGEPIGGGFEWPATDAPKE